MSKSPFRRPTRALVAITLLASLGAAAAVRADEQIVLPFDCQVAGGAVRAVPSSDQAYRVYGAREQKRVRACSERDPGRCRSYMVHRFNMACGPHRVAWPEFYAAISEETDGRAYFDQGRLYYRLGARWNRRDNYGFDYPFPHRRGGGGVVEMPPGFAPLVGTQAIFTPLDPRVAALEDGATETLGQVDADGLPVVRAPDQSVLPPEPVPVPKSAREPHAPDKKPFAPAIAKATPAPAPAAAPKAPIETSSTEKTATAEPPAPAAPAPPPPVAAAPAAAEPPPASAATPLAPTILNNPTARQVQAAAAEQTAAPGTVVAAREIAIVPAPPTGGPSVRGWDNALGGPSFLLSPIAVAIAIAAVTLGLLLMILNRQATAPAGYGVAERATVEPVLPGLSPRPGPGVLPGSQSLVVHETPDPPSPTGLAAASPGMPATRDDALEVLGLSADATEAVIRKVVEALRQSWHPDMASGGEDRLQREERLKRINVASDILLRRPAA